ncbi:hypothetical protein GQ55_3G112400 [Panicum hallii var. hallii]|uniref:DUF1618 domain-containing protein n=1 Tax=Panicum hallii var. hallii TaxID=1504633 RepID=A0A2T7E892_9POAL|nr:hypothetical protein GQ55_3G112400 [Panicum hallii var. hallii]
MPAAAQEPWSILAAIPEVVMDKKAAKRAFPPGAGAFVAFDEPPRPSVLTPPLRRPADRSGLLLLCGTQPMSTDSVMVSYHVCDAVTGEGDAGCMIAALQSGRCHGVDTGAAVLLSYKVGDCRMWREREIAACSPRIPRDSFPEGVVSHGGMLWWVDLSRALLACDPFADEPELLHIPLPTVADELPADSRINRGALGCVKWIPELSVPLAEVWMDESYVNTKLPSSIPAIALIHPMDPDRLFFFLGSSIFAVDLQLRKVVGFSEFEMLNPPRTLRRKRPSRFVHAWQYDPSSTRPEFVSACLGQEKAIAGNMSNYSGIYPASYTGAYYIIYAILQL